MCNTKNNVTLKEHMDCLDYMHIVQTICKGITLLTLTHIKEYNCRDDLLQVSGGLVWLITGVFHDCTGNCTAVKPALKNVILK